MKSSEKDSKIFPDSYKNKRFVLKKVKIFTLLSFSLINQSAKVADKALQYLICCLVLDLTSTKSQLSLLTTALLSVSK